MKRVELGVLVGAMALHGAGLIVARSIPQLETLSPALQRPAMLVEVESMEMPIVQRRIDPKVDPLEESTDSVDRPAASIIDPSRNRSRTATTGTDGGEPGGDPSEPAGPGDLMTGEGPEDEGWSVPEGPGGPGRGGPFGPGVSPLAAAIALRNAAAPAAPTTTPKRAKVSRDAANKLIKDELRAKDKKLGLDLPAAGTIASLIKSAVQSSDAPGAATATFQVVLGPGGKVQRVSVLSFAGGAASTYEGIARTVKAALAARKLNLPEDFAKGAIVVVNAKSKMQMPSGAEVGAGLKLSLTQTFDVADIGASPVRVVAVSFSSKPIE